MTSGHGQLAVLADPTRRAIFERIARKPVSVAELAGGFAVSRPAVSQHLRVLKNAELVRHTPRGTRNIYQIDPRAGRNAPVYRRDVGSRIGRFQGRS